jgi:virginiamycin A acetyltransferase
MSRLIVTNAGVTLGDGAVVAANSHVVKSVAPYTVVGGNPARLIRRRFDDDSMVPVVAAGPLVVAD